MIVYPDLGEAELLRRLVAPTADDVADPWTLRLFVNDYTPNRSSLVAAFDEAAWSGYSPIDLEPADWQPVGIVGGRAVVQWSDTFVSFENDGADETAYGYYLVSFDGTLCIGAERFAEPQVVAVGNPLVFFLTLALRSQFEPAP